MNVHVDMSIEEIKKIQRDVIVWYRMYGRKFPWRDPGKLEPYKALITEILLQRTRAETVAKIWHEFFEKYPTINDLAESDPEDLLKIIGKLGLSVRAERLIKIAKLVVEQFNGNIPQKFEELLLLPGVGPYIASAVLCFAYNKPVPVVDVNIMRLLNRFKGITDELKARKFLSVIIPRDNPREFNWGLIDIAAILCRPENPICDKCPLDRYCLKLKPDPTKWKVLRKRVKGKTVELILQPYSLKGKRKD